MALKRISDLQNSTSLVGDELVELSQVSSTIRISSSVISAVASDNSFNDSAAGFITAGFAVGDRVRVTGFANSVNNLATGTITALTTDKMTIGGADGDVIIDEAVGSPVTIAKWTSVKALLSELSGDSLPSGGGGGSGGGLVSAAMVSVSARYWRLAQIQAFTPSTAPALSGLEFRPSVGGSRLTGTGVASTEDGGAFLTNALNNDSTGSMWSALVGGGPDDSPWIIFDLGSGNESELKEIMFRARTDGYFITTPRTFEIHYSDDGENWHILGSVYDTGATYTSGEVRTFNVEEITKKLTLQSIPYDINFGFSTTPTADQVVGSVLLPRAVTLPANLVGTVGYAGTNPTASFELSLEDDGVEIATITIDTGGVFTLATTGGTAKDVALGSVLTLVAPTTPDASIADVLLGLKGSLT